MGKENDHKQLSRERDLDWLTALLPLWLISLFYYRLQAAALEVSAVGGYAAAAVLLAWISRDRDSGMFSARAAVIGLLTAFCLPAAAPFWLAALGGGIAAIVDSVPALLRRKWPQSPLAQPLLHPSVAAFLLLRLLFRAAGEGYTLPWQWAGVDTLASATPLAAFSGHPLTIAPWQLFFGVQAGAIGETCIAAVLLTAVYLLLRRRLRLIAPACMLAVVSLLSWWWWNSPLYALLAGGVALTALLLADSTYTPHAPADQVWMGVVAGTVTVLMRRFSGWPEGAAAGLLAAQVLRPLLPFIYRWLDKGKDHAWALGKKMIKKISKNGKNENNS